MKRLLTLMAIILVTSMMTRSASALPSSCICNHLPCPCASIERVCPLPPVKICPIQIDPLADLFWRE
jgi:hypothetical protein